MIQSVVHNPHSNINNGEIFLQNILVILKRIIGSTTCMICLACSNPQPLTSEKGQFKQVAHVTYESWITISKKIEIVIADDKKIFINCLVDKEYISRFTWNSKAPALKFSHNCEELLNNDQIWIDDLTVCAKKRCFNMV